MTAPPPRRAQQPLRLRARRLGEAGSAQLAKRASTARWGQHNSSLSADGPLSVRRVGALALRCHSAVAWSTAGPGTWRPGNRLVSAVPSPGERCFLVTRDLISRMLGGLCRYTRERAECAAARRQTPSSSRVDFQAARGAHSSSFSGATPCCVSSRFNALIVTTDDASVYGV